MKKKLVMTILFLFFVLFLLAAGVYFGLAEYYKGSFSVGTWLNGVYCTGKSIEQVNEELLDGYTYDKIIITNIDGQKELLSFQDLEVKADFSYSLRSMLSTQNPYLWIDHFTVGITDHNTAKRELTPEITVQTEQIKKAVASLSFVKNEIPKEERKVAIVPGEHGYVLEDGRVNVLSVLKLEEELLEAVQTGKNELDLAQAGCYEDLPVTEEMKQTYALWEKIKTFQENTVTYLFGETQEVLDAGFLAGFLQQGEDGIPFLDEQNELLLNEEKIKEYVQRLAEKYDTYGKPRQFKTSSQKTVTIEKSIYGNQLDQKAEEEFLLAALKEGKKQQRIPEYKQKALVQGENDIGDTYIEIDMTSQKMFCYLSGELYVETPIVTGNMIKKRSTPSLVCFVYAKQKNRTLRGPGYASFVNFWMPVKGGIGIHDASWRKEFGGEIYITNGSHGCINTPYDQMAKIYDSFEVGTPVIMYY